MNRGNAGLGVALASVVLLGGCGSVDSTSVHVGVGMGYGGYYDPWYYGPGYGPPVIVAPRPPYGGARPPMARPTPLPARPGPRPMPRGR
jgi:hypothetical protein